MIKKLFFKSNFLQIYQKRLGVSRIHYVPIAYQKSYNTQSEDNSSLMVQAL